MKKFTSGFLVATLIFGSLTTFASSGRTIQVFDNVKRILVNKVEKPFDKNNVPFVYNGTTYVPLRFIADALGESINWDGETGTIFIGDMENKNTSYLGKDVNIMNKKVSGVYSHTFSCEYGSEKFRENNIGDKYSNYLIFAGMDTSYPVTFVEFPLNGQFSKFQGILAIPSEGNDKQGDRPVKIYADDKLIFEKTIDAASMPSTLDLDVTGANKLRFELDLREVNNLNYGMHVGIYDGKLIK